MSRDGAGGRPRSIGVLQPTFERWGGAEWFIHQTLGALARDGREVVLYTHRWEDPPGGAPAGYRVVEHRYGGYASHPWDWRRIARALVAEWQRHDVLFVHNYPATVWFAEARRAGLGAPGIWYCHEPPAALHDPEAAAPARGPRRATAAAIRFYGRRLPWRLLSEVRARLPGAPIRAGLMAIEREAVASFGTVLANSRYTAGRVRELYGVEAAVVPPVPADLPRLAPPEGQRKEKLVLWVGRLTEAKRPLLMLDAWREARGGAPALAPFRLLLVGDGPLAAEVARRAADDPSAEHVRALTREELIERYRSALLAVHLGRDEPFGLVPLEAMAAGTAVLAVAGGGVGETVEPGVTGDLLPEAGRPRIARRLAELLADPEALARMGAEAARRVRERFDPARSLAAIEQALAGAAPPGAGVSG